MPGKLSVVQLMLLFVACAVGVFAIEMAALAIVEWYTGVAL